MLDSWFLTENLPFSPAASLRKPPPSTKLQPGARMRSSRLWRVSSFHFLPLHHLGVTTWIGRVSLWLSCTQPGGTGSCWKQPFSSRLTNAVAAKFTNLVGSVEQGYAAAPVIEDMLTAHLSPTSTPPCGSPTLSFRLSYVGPPPLWSVSPTWHETGRCSSPHYGHPSGLPSGGTEGDGWGGRCDT